MITAKQKARSRLCTKYIYMVHKKVLEYLYFTVFVLFVILTVLMLPYISSGMAMSNTQLPITNEALAKISAFPTVHSKENHHNR